MNDQRCVTCDHWPECQQTPPDCITNGVPATEGKAQPDKEPTSTKGLEVSGWCKQWEQDVYKEGCQPGTSGLITGSETFTHETQEEMIADLMAFVDTDDKENVLINSCDEPGRIDIQKMETDDADTPSPEAMQRWKQGKQSLWLATYTFHVELVERQPAELTA